MGQDDKEIKCTAIFCKTSVGTFLKITQGNGLVPQGTMLEITQGFVKKMRGANPIKITFRRESKKPKKSQ